jgi:hypothetical protein
VLLLKVEMKRMMKMMMTKKMRKPMPRRTVVKLNSCLPLLTH